MNKGMNYRKSNNYRSVNKGMAGEKLLITIEKYIGLDLILMLLSLLHESDGMRGYPFVWAGGGPERIPAFFASLAVITALVLAGDLITRAYIRISEPVTSVQKTLDKYASTYSEYEDPYVSEIKYNASSSVRNASSSARRTSAPDTGRSAPRAGSYEKSIASDYEKIKGILSEQQKRLKEEVKERTVTAKPLLNGMDASKNQGDKNKSSGLAVAIAVLIICLVSLGFSVFDDGTSYEEDDNWGEDIIAEDTDYYSSEYETIVSMSQELLDQLSSGDAEWFESIGGKESDAEELIDLTGYNITYYEPVYAGYIGYGKDMDGITRFRVECEDRYYLAAFRFIGDDIDNGESIPDLSGFAICPYPSFDEDASLGFGSTSLEEFIEDNGFVDDDAFETCRDEVAMSTMSAGNTTIEDTSIIIW